MKKVLFLFVLFAVLVSACKGEADDEIFKISDPAQQLEAEAGNEFKLIIESNPSTGYHWELAEELDESVVKFVSREYRAEEPVIPGSGGVDVWVGSLPGTRVTAVICTVDMAKRDVELKLLLGCAPEEAEIILQTHNSHFQSAILIRRMGEWANERISEWVNQ